VEYKTYTSIYAEKVRKYTPLCYTNKVTVPLSKYLIYLYLRLNISANIITALSLLYAILSMSLLVNYKNPLCFLMGALFLQFTYVNDYSDGGVARYNESTSPFGEYYDLIIDRLVSIIVYGAFIYILMIDKKLENNFSTMLTFYSVSVIILTSYALDLKKRIFNNPKVMGSFTKGPYYWISRTVANLIDTGFVYLVLTIGLYYNYLFHIIIAYGLINSISLFYSMYALRSSK
jgi:phosphatidylglycerophosphate synthase